MQLTVPSWELLRSMQPCMGVDAVKGRLDVDFKRRSDFVVKYSWAYPSKFAIEAIKDFVGNDWVLEVCSGLGLWAGLMAKSGIKVFATDAAVQGYTVLSKKYLDRKHSFHYTYKFEAKVAPKVFSAPKVLFMCWPCYDEPLAYEALKAFTGNKFIYIGEGHGGCTASDAFFELLGRDWEEGNSQDIPQWFGIHDRMTFFERKNAN